VLDTVSRETWEAYHTMSSNHALAEALHGHITWPASPRIARGPLFRTASGHNSNT
jgi:hypothetical protein